MLLALGDEYTYVAFVMLCTERVFMLMCSVACEQILVYVCCWKTQSLYANMGE